MPQPVQPPETPTIIQYLPSEDTLHLGESSTTPSVLPTNPNSTNRAIATPTVPETLAPEWAGSQAIGTNDTGRLESNSASSQPQPIPNRDTRAWGRGDTGKLESNSPSQPQPTPNHHTPSESSSVIPSQGATLLGSPISVSESNLQQPTPTGELPVNQSNPLPPSPPPLRTTFRYANSPSPDHATPLTLQLSNVKRLVAQERGGEVREFEFTIPEPETPWVPDQDVAPTPTEEEPPSPVTPESETPEPETSTTTTGVLELTADQQEYDQNRQVITAQGNVLLRFRGALLNADRVQVNLPNRILVAEGNVTLTRGDQVLRGERFEYYFVQDSGVVLNARGEIYVPTSGRDLTILPSPSDPNAPEEQRPASDRVTSNQPLLDVTNSGFYSFVLGGSLDDQRSISNASIPDSGGAINRFRYEADRVDFEGSEAIATNVRLTNDPFSPPELELRADTARFRRLSPLVDEVVASRPRLVFDGGFSVPTFRNRVIIDRREREPGLFNIGFDDDDRGGVFIERNFEILNTPTLRFEVKPQYFIQKAILDESVIDPSVFGLKTRFDATLSPTTTFTAAATLTSFKADEIEDELRASLRLRQVIGSTIPHRLSLEYIYRDRIFNGSLGFQTVRSSIGAVVTSPVIPLGNSGINLTYQGAIQNINADTDRQDLLPPPPRDNRRINLTRYQAGASLNRSFLLWQGEALPATPTEGLRYTPRPVVPYLQLRTRVTGVASAYSNGDTQESLSGTIGLVGQLGHFSKPYFDYTGFNISYTQVARGNPSPFRFDRVADRSVLSGGITQQIYGPFRIGFQTSYNLDTGKEISTDLFVEYSRRTYNILLRYNPVQQLGSISFQINDFNWTGNPGVFDCSENRPVVQGVDQCIGSAE